MERRGRAWGRRREGEGVGRVGWRGFGGVDRVGSEWW